MIATKRFLSGALVAAALAAAPVTAHAYEFIQNCSDGSGGAWAQSEIPVRYYLNSAGSDDLPFSTVTQIMEDSYEAWAEPCSSSFRYSYQGTTSETAFSNNRRVVHSFSETASQWPRELGDPYDGTLAVTLTSFRRNCTFYNAPIVYNGVAVTWTDQCNAQFCQGGGTDLQSVATHEIGHMLGLDHSSVNSATMYFAYLGGNIARSLHPDDVNGVSALYPNVCSCTQDSDCIGDLVECQNSRCVDVPCSSDSQCAPGLACLNTGECGVPPCGSDADCGQGFSCLNAVCKSTCPVCRDCTASNQCGSGGTCVDWNGDGAGECITFCDDQGACPGDASCFGLEQDGQTYYLCLNPTANSQGVCPDSYVCEDVPLPPNPCEGVDCGNDGYCRDGQCIPYPGNGNNDPGNTNNDPGNTNNDPGTTNNDPGNTNNDPGTVNNDPGGGNNDPGNTNGQGGGDDDLLIIIEDDGRSNAPDGACAAAPLGAPAPLGVWLLAICVGGLARRARRRREAA